jgi:ABC-type Fe3+ transport system permease subunit
MEFFLLIITFFLGIYLGIRAFKHVNFTSNEVSFGQIIVNSIMAGVSGTLLFFFLIGVMGYLDKTYTWSIYKAFGSIIISLIPGGIITIGSFIQNLITVRYKESLLDYLRKKEEK